MIRCQQCKIPFHEVGREYTRVDGKVDFYCTYCGCKKKPVDDCRYENNYLFIGDTHLPFVHDGYLEFVQGVAEKYQVHEDNVYHVGDFTDNHAISFHTHDPDGLSSGDELDALKESAQPWFDAFPKMKVCIGNHDALPQRQAEKLGLSSRWVRTIMEVLDAPEGWEYEREFWIGDTKVIHGTGFSGMYPHANAARNHMTNVIMGHAHSVAGIHSVATERSLVWGMAVGCGIDRHSYAFNYARNLARKPVISCGVLVGGKTPVLEFMEL